KVEEKTEEKMDEEIDTIPPPKPDYPETPTIYPPKSGGKKTTPKVPPPKPPESGNALLPIIGLGVLLVVVLVTVLGIYVNNDTNNAPPQSTETPVDSETQPGDPFENDMVYVEGGTFTMGCTPEQGSDCEDDEKPPYSKTVSNFYMGKYEVTQAQWRQVMGSNPPELYNTGCDQCPVESVSHDDIQQFLKKLNQQTGKSYRLPTEAEWEYAARGGNKSKGYKYAGSNNIDAVAWYYYNYQQSKHGAEGTTHPVGAKAANELDLYDMSGNVWEWCQDWFKGYPGSSGVSDETGAIRVLRGGSFSSNAQSCRVSFRGNNTPGNRDSHRGFRLVVSP
ncbi:MAG TPA: formylglycine-generating enzyme family protein, partial [Chitinophagales bacterium]|nr:formylglycine-generating enzyme family protein [Chitinophagales bacterium]